MSGLGPKSLVADVRRLILDARQHTATAVNAALTTLYWQIGRRIREDILNEKRAEYGEKIVHALSAKLTAEFGRGFDEKNLRRMVQFAEVFPDSEIVATLRRQLGWSHFKVLIPVDDPTKRDFYAEMCRVQRWSTRTLEKKIGTMLYERTALSRKPAKLITKEIDALRAEDKLTPDLVFQDPYILNFLGLKDKSNGLVPGSLILARVNESDRRSKFLTAGLGGRLAASWPGGSNASPKQPPHQPIAWSHEV